jgi:hypothetical protein
VLDDGKSGISVARLFNYSQVNPIWPKQNTDLQAIIVVFAVKLSTADKSKRP